MIDSKATKEWYEQFRRKLAEFFRRTRGAEWDHLSEIDQTVLMELHAAAQSGADSGEQSEPVPSESEPSDDEPGGSDPPAGGKPPEP